MESVAEDGCVRIIRLYQRLRLPHDAELVYGKEIPHLQLLCLAL